MIYYLTEGEYSYFEVVGVFEGPDGPGLDLDEFKEKYKKVHPENMGCYTNTNGEASIYVKDEFLPDFVEFLKTEAGLTSIDAKEIHIDQ